MTSKQEEQRERRDLAGSTTALTYHRQAQIDAGLEGGGGGRFAQLARRKGGAKPSVVGQSPTIQYPRLPAGSPWSGPDNPLEPPLGWSVEDMEPVGTAEEIAKGLAASLQAPTPSQGGVVETGDAANPEAPASIAAASALQSADAVAAGEDEQPSDSLASSEMVASPSRSSSPSFSTIKRRHDL